MASCITPDSIMKTVNSPVFVRHTTPLGQLMLFPLHQCSTPSSPCCTLLSGVPALMNPSLLHILRRSSHYPVEKSRMSDLSSTISVLSHWNMTTNLAYPWSCHCHLICRWKGTQVDRLHENESGLGSEMAHILNLLHNV